MTDLGVDDADYAEQIVSLLWPGAPGAADGQTRQGGLLALPSVRRARLLVPAGRRRAAASAARRYHARPGSSAGLSTALLATGLRTGLVQLVARRRSWLPGGTSEAGGITAQLREIVSAHCEVAVYLGIPRANRKPVLLVLEPDGALSGVAKLGVSSLSHFLIRNEAAALRQLAGARLTRVTVPRVLFAGQWSGGELLVQSALPQAGQEPSDAEQQRELAAVEISGVGGLMLHRLETSPVLARLDERIAQLPAGVERELARRTVAQLREAVPDVQFPVGSWHGDWTPWNVAATRTRGVLAWDWERFARCIPAGYDALHYCAQAGATLPGGPAAGLAATRASVDALLGPFGVAAAAREPVFGLYLVELLVRYTADGQARLPIGRRWADALAVCLGALLTGIARQPHQQRNAS